MQDVVNYMEIWVKECMEILLEKIDSCKCDRCRRDIFTLSLNNLRPYYVSTQRGTIMARLDSCKQQFETDIIVEVTKAINKINANPNHDVS